jgi:hypothetical protein
MRGIMVVHAVLWVTARPPADFSRRPLSGLLGAGMQSLTAIGAAAGLTLLATAGEQTLPAIVAGNQILGVVKLRLLADREIGMAQTGFASFLFCRLSPLRAAYRRRR